MFEEVCSDCFYKDRTNPYISCIHYNARKIRVQWNSRDGRQETVFIRPLPKNMPPHVSHVAMCDPSRGTCRQNWCTFAHGRAEQKAWNSILRQQLGEAAINDAGITRNQQRQQCLRPMGWYAAGEETFQGRLEEDLDYNEIKVPLSRQNYKRKFNNLICWEERRHIEVLDQKCDEICSLHIFPQGFKPYWIKAVGPGMRYGFINLDTDKIAYATQASEGAFVVPYDIKSMLEVKLMILRENYEHSDEKLYVAFDEKKSSILSQIISRRNKLPIEEKQFRNVLVEFEVKHNYFDSLVKAINQIPSKIINRILPTPGDFFELLEPYHDEYLHSLLPCGIEIDNDGQFCALRQVLSCDPKSPPVIINGSFGTGKTRLLAVITHCIIQHGKARNEPVRVLICAHHQRSADHFIDNYFANMFNTGNVELVRLLTKQSNRRPKFYKACQDYVKTQRRPSQYLVIVTTFLTAPRLLKVFRDTFTHILLDEGSQSREPDAIAPLSLAGPNTKLVIAGDPQQVGPSVLVLGEKARKNGLKDSLQERLQDLYEQYGGNALNHMVSLNTNYRCHADIMKISNELFYGSKIKANPLNAFPHPEAKYPLIFVCSTLSSSADTNLEAKLLLKEIKRFVVSWPDEWGCEDLSKISLVTTSRTQLVITRRLARSKFNELKHIRMVPTFDIQGQEFQAVFLSTIEPVNAEGNTTNPTKSPCDPYIFNTILTRSKSLVVVVGSPLALLGIETHMTKLYGKKACCWSRYISICLEKGTFVIPDEVENRNAVKQGFISGLKARVSKQYVAPIKPDGLPITSYPVMLDNTPAGVHTNSQPTTIQQDPLSHAPLAAVSSGNHGSNSVASEGKNSNEAINPNSLTEVSQNKEAVKSVTTPVRNSQYYNEYKDQLKANADLLKEPLVATNYKEKFHHLLCWEEQEHDKQLAQRCNKTYDIVMQNGEKPDHHTHGYNDVACDRYGYITSDDSDTLTHAKQASQGSFIILDKDLYIHVMHVQASVPKEANFSAISFGFEKEQHEILKKSKNYKKISYGFKAEVRFELKHRYFNQLHQAVQHLPLHVIGKLIPTGDKIAHCNPNTNYKIYSPKYESIELDRQVQMKALHVILQSIPTVPVLVTGPFGTGKTRLLARAAYEILKRKNTRVLICAHHQHSVDTFVEYFGAMIMDKDTPWEMTMLRVIPNKNYRSQTRNNYYKFFKAKHSLTSHGLQRNRLVISTLGLAQSLFRVLPEKKRGFFTHILIDEGAQTREPEAVGPLNLAGRYTTIVIAGDHCQVGPKLLVLGKEAQSNGLGVSLLERLHALYDSVNVLPKFSVTLLTNYRCHSGILMLPSSLYYHSTLQCRVPDDSSHPLAPFPLTFVCSDIKHDKWKTSGVNEHEAEAVIQAVKRYFSKWPKNWSKEDKKVCIMSPSADQCYHIRKKVVKSKMEQNLGIAITILKAYDIQGTEFRTIFISTSEPTNENGEPINTTKSICDRFVFNTALTRSRSLVVAVGNPFLLLKMEENAIKKFDSTYKTWSPYIKQCIECDTFSYSESIKSSNSSSSIQASTHELYDYIYSDTSGNSSTILKPLDSIIEDYKRVFESIPACEKAKLSLSSKGSRLTWSIKDYEDQGTLAQEESDYPGSYLCKLRIDTYQKAEAVPYDSNRKIVKIQGLKNRKGAFNGDKVMVEVFDDSPHGKCYGHIVKVTERGSDLKFVCRVDFRNPIIFRPIDKKNPSLINLPRLSRDLLRKKEREEINQSDLKANDVVVFDPNSYDVESEDVPLPRISQVIPISVARNMLFLVSYVRWEEKYRSPLGIVIGAYRKGDTLYNAERMLKIVHSVEYNSSDQGGSQSDDVPRDPSMQFCNRAFTIDPEEAQNLDDALSIVKVRTDEDGRAVYQLGVHIVNAAKHIQPDTEIDRLAMNKGISLYGGESGKIMHMLHDNHTRCTLSLTPGKVRDVISVTCSITLSQPFDISSLNPSDLQLGECEINPAQIRSAIQLTYKEAQCVFDGGIPEKHSEAITQFEDGVSLSLSETLKFLYAVVINIRQKRFQSNAAFSYDINDQKEVCCWQMHMLIEELMIWANSKVAECIHSHYPNAAILRKQEPPNIEKRQAILDANASVMLCSPHLSHYLAGNDNLSAPSVDISIPLDTLKQIHKAVYEGNMPLLSHLLSVDRFYPQLAVVKSKLRAISLRAEYCCTNSSEDGTDSEYRHDSLSLDKYTHFTSPMRRYTDIQVQRMLLNVSGVQEGKEFSHEDQWKLCTALNIKAKNASDYERKLCNVRLAIKLAISSKPYTAFINQLQDGKKSVELAFTDLELRHFPSKDQALRITNFIPLDKNGDLYTWKLRITSLKSDLAAHVLETTGQCLSAPTSDDDANIFAYCIYDDSSLNTEQFIFSQPSSVVSVTASSWQKAQEFIKNPTEEKMLMVSKVLPQISPLPSSFSVNLAPAQYLFLKCDITASLKESDSLKVWLTWGLRGPVISPTIQLVEVSPLLRICMQHNSHPAECFSDPDLSQASKRVYESLQDYIDRWKKVLLAEAAEKSVKGCQPVIIRDVILEWPELKIPDECIDEQYYVPAKSIRMFLPQHFIENCYEFFRVNVGDLVCVRYECGAQQSVRAVYHFVVHKIPEDNTDEGMSVCIEPVGQQNCRVSEAMKRELDSGTCTCEVQLIALDHSYRKVFSILLALERGRENHQSQCVAIAPASLGGHGNFSSGSIASAKKDELATSISKWNLSKKPPTFLNECQKKSMHNALTKKFQLIQGPPGTGKSVTGAHIAYVFTRLNTSNQCVLYCGPSNKSVDVVFENFHNLAQTKGGKDLRILRIYSSAVEKKDYPGPELQTHKTPDTKCPDWAKPYALHHMIRQEGVSPELVKLEQKLENMKKEGTIASGKWCKMYRKEQKEAFKAFLAKNKFDIVFCTCNEAAGVRVRKNISPCQCIIDECGMAYEPEAIAPIGLCEHTVLIGDHMQLQPVIDYQPAKDNGLTTSLFARYAEHYEEYLFTLDTQYRMHEAICRFPSEEFYGKKLITDPSVVNRPPKDNLETFWPQGNELPIMFVDVVGNEGLDKIRSSKEAKVGTDSKYNLVEAKLVVAIARTLLKQHRVPVEDVAILTPYSAQKNKLLEIVKKLPREFRNLKVASINESQGDEYGIVILSTVRSLPLDEIRYKHYVQADRAWMREHLGFITDRHQINVGITRSKYGLIITGNKTLLEYDSTWEKLLQHYDEKGCVVDASRY